MQIVKNFKKKIIKKILRVIFKGIPDLNHFIFEINVGKGRARHKTTLNLNDEFLDRPKFDCRLKFRVVKKPGLVRSICMSDPTFSDIDFKKRFFYYGFGLNYP